MSETPQLLAKHEENINSIRGQADTYPVDTGMGNRLAKAAIGGKETIIMSETPQLLAKPEENVNPNTGQTDAHPVDTGMGNRLAKVAIGAVVGTVVGTLAGALANKKTAQSINRTVKGVGDTVKGAAQGVDRTVKGVGDKVKGAAQGVAKGVDRSVKGAGDAVKGTAEGVNDAVKGVAENVQPSVKGTVDRVRDTVEDAKPSVNQGDKLSDNQSFKLYEERLVADKKQVKTAEVTIRKHVETQTAHISVPLKKERLVVEQTTPVNAGTPVAPGVANFHEGEVARMEIYEETANVQKQAFVREEVSVRKEVEHDTVEVEDSIRREELYLDNQGPNVIDKTKTL